MSHKERAKSLINSFISYASWGMEDTEYIAHQNAKQCAIICVEQIIEGIESIIGDQKHMWREGESEQHQYYTKVLEHIKNS